ncbi:hypothetical protein BN946_scf185010.g20 [Trametes cinnabarina]|uniref:RRM domain-containing protein n=1 Tax=Pycnoporus cinnabarinus TaxID=5643 RepID=A0A060SL17_PYCCI|nr:hypothetical protein BN946_scf185010.g20 [Trametes cinnabarina]
MSTVPLTLHPTHRLVFDRDTGKPKGYGFCEFADHETAMSAVRNLNGQEIGGRPLRIDLADSDPFLEGKTTVRGEIIDGGETRAQWRERHDRDRHDDHRPGRSSDPNAFLANLPKGVPLPPGSNALDAISHVLASTDPSQILEVLAQMKAFVITHPEQARALLVAHPQLGYALFQALLLHKIVDPAILNRMLAATGAAVAAPAAPAPAPAPPVAQPAPYMPPLPTMQQQQPPMYPPAYPPPSQTPVQHPTPPVPPTMYAQPPSQMQLPSYYRPPPPSAAPVPQQYQPPPTAHAPPQAPAQPPAVPDFDQTQREMLLQVLRLTPEQLNTLPPTEREQIMQLDMPPIRWCSYALAALSGGWHIVSGQQVPPNSFPHVWPGQPKGDFSPEWQKYFEVTAPLPGIPTGLPRSFAGNIPVDRPGHPNDTLFFWGFERQGANGTLTAPANPNNTDPWILWIQGGPGSSGLLGLSTENGPIHVLSNGSWVVNPLSWNTLADTIWIDQPVGTGFSTADTKGYGMVVLPFPSGNPCNLLSLVADEDQMAEDFPYIAKHLFARTSGPVNLRKIAIGDGSLGSLATIRDLPVINIIETYPALIGYDQEVFNYFREQHHLCGFDLNLTYPQNGTFPTLNLTAGLRQTLRPPSDSARTFTSWKDAFRTEYASGRDFDAVDGSQRRAEWKRDLSGRTNGTLDPWYGCDVFDELRDYALNFTFPWTNGGFDVYDIPDATNPEPPKNAAPFLNDPRTRAALHAPTSKNWTSSFNYPFGSVYNKSIGNEHGDPSVEPVAFLTDLATNATARNVSIVFYSGNDDAQVQHRGTEVVIQNFTFGGTQGFTRKPSTPWFDDDGNFAGIVHQERNITYLLFDGAGHLVPEWKPAQALVFLREFVLGSNKNGTVEGTSVVGGENSTLAGDYFPGGNEIFYGSAATQGTSTVPSATIAAWNSFLATATAAAGSGAGTSEGSTTTGSATSTSTTSSRTPNGASINKARSLSIISHLLITSICYVVLYELVDS